MNQSLNLNFNPTALLEALKKYYGTIIGMSVVTLVLFTGYQISQITGVEPDPVHLEKLTTESKVISLKGNKEVLENLQKLQPAGDTTVPINLGKNNPFSLQ